MYCRYIHIVHVHVHVYVFKQVHVCTYMYMLSINLSFQQELIYHEFFTQGDLVSLKCLSHIQLCIGAISAHNYCLHYFHVDMCRALCDDYIPLTSPGEGLGWYSQWDDGQRQGLHSWAADWIHGRHCCTSVQVRECAEDSVMVCDTLYVCLDHVAIIHVPVAHC